MKRKPPMTLLAALLPLAGLAQVTVDDRLPAGNIVCEAIEGDVVKLHQDLRDSTKDWFYWKFRISGAAGCTMRFRFTRSWAVGSRGAAVSTDRGRTWRWTDESQSSSKRQAKTGDHADARAFDWTFGSGDNEVWFAQTIPYDAADWRAFLDRHAADSGRLFEEGVLCRSRKGRAVECARFGRLDGKATNRIFLSARHHCGEATADFVLEGVLEQVFADDALGRWLRENVEFRVVPFADKDGVVDGDQGKWRAPRDHARDYGESRAPIYPEVGAIMKMLRDWQPTIVNDFHCPWLRGSWFEKDNTNEFIYQVGLSEPGAWARQEAFGQALERVQRAGLRYSQADDFPAGRGWNSAANWTQGMPLVHWAARTFTNAALVTSWEIPFANQRYQTLHPAEFRAFGRDVAAGYRALLAPDGAKPCSDGIYPHLAMFNDEGECGTGAVVPWAGSLWAITYGPHCPVGSSDKLYQITPDLRQIVRSESVGGTHANRLVHRASGQLLIGPYVIDSNAVVRTIPIAALPGRLTGVALDWQNPAKVYVTDMEEALYRLDMTTLATEAIIRDGHNDAVFSAYFARTGAKPPVGWGTAEFSHLFGYHGKGTCSGFGKVFYANNGEHSPRAMRDPFTPAGCLAQWQPGDRQWTLIRTNQFTEVTTRDGIYGNEHSGENPIWALGWDAKSVILAVTTNGTHWTDYRLAKGSHCYDGAHGWNTEWPRIRDVGEKDLLATMHGTFWRFPRDFSPANPNGIRPISTYLKVIGDFCRWGERIVFGCDDQAQSEFLGKRALKKGAKRRDRSQSNLWFVRPDELDSFGPPSGEGWVWLNENVRAGDVSDPFLAAGYEDVRFTFTDQSGRAIRHELLHDGDWTRVKALETAEGVSARFRCGPRRPQAMPPVLGCIEVEDDSHRVYRFPNVNGDKTVLCREVATERDLLYVGGVFYEVPADNAGGFAALRPIALADEPVREIEAKLGLVFINGRPQAVDALWQNGTAATAYWLWESR